MPENPAIAVNPVDDMYPLSRDDASAPFFDAAARGVLLIRRCAGGHFDAPQALTCAACGSRELEWVEASGAGTIASYAVFHRRDRTPLPVAIVELAEGPWLRGQVQQATELAMGQSVRVAFATPEGGETIPYFIPANV